MVIRETAHHRERFLRYTNEPPCRLEMRLYTGSLRKDLDDRLPKKVLDPDDYSTSQKWGKRLRDAKSYGLLYPSVRYPGGRCAALFRPPAIGPLRQDRHYLYRFDGERITDVVTLGDYKSL